MTFWEVVGLEDTSIPHHLEVCLIWSNLWPMNGCHAGLFPQFMDNFLFFICSRSDLALRPINYILVDASLIESALPAVAGTNS